jgi:hypothetical protein
MSALVGRRLGRSEIVKLLGASAILPRAYGSFT